MIGVPLRPRGHDGISGGRRGGSRGLVLLFLGRSLGKQGLVGDRWEHLGGAVPAPVVVGVDEGGDLASGLVLGGEVPARQKLVLEGRVEALRRGVGPRRQRHPIRLVSNELFG